MLYCCSNSHLLVQRCCSMYVVHVYNTIQLQMFPTTHSICGGCIGDGKKIFKKRQQQKFSVGGRFVYRYTHNYRYIRNQVVQHTHSTYNTGFKLHIGPSRCCCSINQDITVAVRNSIRSHGWSCYSMNAISLISKMF
jgi:hypothetical protein